MVIELEAVRAEALFVSPVQRSDRPDPVQVRRAVATSLRRYRIRGCAARVAGEYGDHPETAVDRMAWALATVRAVYPPPARSVSRLERKCPAGSAAGAGCAVAPATTPG